MIVREFPINYHKYQNFAIWEIDSMDSFFKGNEVLSEIFRVEYQIPVEDFKDRRQEIDGTDMSIMMNLLDLVGDKHFFIFTLGDENHVELVKMQAMKVMDFGMNIEEIKGDHVYVILMDEATAGPLPN